MADDENKMNLNLGLPAESRSLAATRSRRFRYLTYSPSNALHAPEFLPVDPLYSADDSPVWEPCIPARLLELETHASDDPNSTPHSSASTGPDQPSAPHRRIPQRQDEAEASINPCSTVHMSELMSRGDRSGSRHEILEYPELRFRSLIESNNRFRPRRSRMSDSERSDSQISPDQLMHDIMQSHRILEASKKDNLHADEGAASFECNICFDIAKEPVVTPCGHLFCWPCLYQWLHVNPVFPECPVCKGEVREANLTPLYGRGGSDTTAKKVSEEDGNLGLKIPPRPHGHRTESLRQELRRSTGRILLGESTRAWRHLDEEVRTAVTFREDQGRSLQLRLNAADQINRPMQWRLQTEEGSGSNITGIAASTNSPTSDGIHLSLQPPLGRASTRRLRDCRISVRPSRRSSGRTATPSVNPHSSEPPHQRPTTVQSTPTAEQASASSTTAAIPGDTAAADIIFT